MDRFCISCERLLIINDNWTQAQASKKNYKCGPCKAEYQKQYHKKNRKSQLEKQRNRYTSNKDAYLEKQKESFIKRTYGISVSEYNHILESSNCKICGSSENKVLDHCHRLGHVRGVLCRKCNMAIGIFKDDSGLLSRALSYILKDEEKSGIHVK